MSMGWLTERMKDWGESPAIQWRDQPFTYAALLDHVALWKEQLDVHRITAGQVVAFKGDYTPQVVSLLLALIDRGAIVVPLTTSMEVHWTEFEGIAEAQAVINFDAADRWQIECRSAGVRNPLTRKLIELGQPGLVLFSSGSTGKNKAALHNFASLLEKFKTPRHRMCILTFLLLDHIGGINTLLYALSNGGTVVSVHRRDPEIVCQAIERHKVQLLPTSPTFLNLLLISEAYRRYDLSSLKLITYGTETMPAYTLTRMHEVFPNAQLQQTYGLSELGILRSKSKSSNSLWVKVGGEGFETKIVDSMLWIRAQSAMMGYLNAPSPFDAEGWMNTQDVVEVDGEYIRILGRQTDIINVGGQKVYPVEVEGVLMQMPNIRDATVYGEKNPITGHIVAARVNLVEPENLADLKNRIRTFCKAELADYKIPIKIEVTQQDQFSARYKKSSRTAKEAFQAAMERPSGR